MKKYLAILAISVSFVGCTNATLVSSDRGFFDEHIYKSEIENKIKGRFDYRNDIAVASRGSKTEIAARLNAEEKMYQEIYNYSYELLSQMMLDANLTGKGFDSFQMKKYAIEIADRYTGVAEEIGKFKDEKKNLYYVALKISKDEIKKQTTRIFKEKVDRVIDRLKQMKEGIN